MRVRILLYIATLCVLVEANAQSGKPNGTFLDSTTRIGQPVKYALSFHHPRTMELFFPDSTYSYAPFEFIKKEYFPTHTRDSISIDSVVYTLRTFEVKKNIDLALPVFIIEQGDTIRLYSSPHKIFIQQYIHEVPDSLVFQSETNYVSVEEKINYPYILAVLFVVFLIFMLFYVILGKAILRNYRLYMMHRNHIQFLRTFEKYHKEMQNSPSLQAMETILGEWKEYLARLEQKPLHTYTTTEIIALFNKEELKESLQVVDRSIYSGSITGDPYKALAVMKKFSNKRYKKRRKELRNAR